MKQHNTGASVSVACAAATQSTLKIQRKRLNAKASFGVKCCCAIMPDFVPLNFHSEGRQ